MPREQCSLRAETNDFHSKCLSNICLYIFEYEFRPSILSSTVESITMDLFQGFDNVNVLAEKCLNNKILIARLSSKTFYFPVS